MQRFFSLSAYSQCCSKCGIISKFSQKQAMSRNINLPCTTTNNVGNNVLDLPCNRATVKMMSNILRIVNASLLMLPCVMLGQEMLSSTPVSTYPPARQMEGERPFTMISNTWTRWVATLVMVLQNNDSR